VHSHPHIPSFSLGKCLWRGAWSPLWLIKIMRAVGSWNKHLWATVIYYFVVFWLLVCIRSVLLECNVDSWATAIFSLKVGVTLNGSNFLARISYCQGDTKWFWSIYRDKMYSTYFHRDHNCTQTDEVNPMILFMRDLPATDGSVAERLPGRSRVRYRVPPLASRIATGRSRPVGVTHQHGKRLRVGDKSADLEKKWET